MIGQRFRVMAGAISVATLLLSGCSTAGNFSSVKGDENFAFARSSPVTVYSFLELREKVFGEDMIDILNQKLEERLEDKGLDVQLRSHGQIIANSDLAGRARLRSGLSRSDRVPVAEALVMNLDGENEHGTVYRLFVVPSDVSIYGYNQSYSITWVLQDLDGQQLWASSQVGGRMVWLSRDENAEGRAEDFVDSLIAEMESSGLFEFENGIVRERPTLREQSEISSI